MIQDMPGVVLFCSMQPCPRQAEGDLVIETEDGVEEIPVCGRHHEYVMHALDNGAGLDIMDREIVFADEVDETVVNEVAERDPYDIVE